MLFQGLEQHEGDWLIWELFGSVDTQNIFFKTFWRMGNTLF